MKKPVLLSFILFIFLFSCSDETETGQIDEVSEKVTHEARKDISFTAKSESVVEVEEIFQIVFNINENISGFNPPDFGAFDILSGPSSSTYSSTQIINGKSAKQISNSYTYTASCSEPGDYIIPEAEITIDGHSYKSNSINIKVIGSEKLNKLSENVKLPKDDIFILTNYSKTEIYNGEYIIATTKIYTNTDFSNINELKFPDYKGFWTKTVQAPRQIQFKNELINGKKYSAAILKQTMIFAQKPGNYEISPYLIDVQIKKKDGEGKDFFGNLVDTYKMINKKLSTKRQTIIVKPLPQPIPKNFSGITGKEFKITAELESESFGPEESTNLKFTVSGNGNIHLLNEFTLNLPENIESFKPEVSNNQNYSGSGAYGEVVFNYVIVAKDQGSYTLEPIEFLYFDFETEQYNTIRTGEYNIIVGTGVSSLNSETGDSNIINTKDIRYIKDEAKNITKSSSGYFGSFYYYLTFILLSIFFVIYTGIRKKLTKAQADVVTVRRKKASRVSKKRLEIAKRYILNNESEMFYKEILTAIWGYLSDKLSVNSVELTNDRISRILTDKNVNDDLIKELLRITEVCGYAQYSPDTQDNSTEKVYEATQIIINKFEEIL